MEIFYFVAQQTMKFAIPLLIVAIGGMYAERSGVINIALDGIMIMGAFVSVLFIYIMEGMGVLTGQPLLVVATLVAAVTGMLFSLLHAFASVNMKADQTISGTALNLFAPAFAIFVARMIIGVQQVPFSNYTISKVPVLGDIPVIGDIFFTNCFITTFICILLYLLAALVISKTKFGLRLRACGEHPGAADSVGVSVEKIRYAGVLISGALAGIGGLAFVIPTSNNFNATVSGYGFLAIAVLIFGQWRSGKILGAAFFFGIMKTLASSYAIIPWLKDLPIPSGIYKMIPYAATLIVLIFTSKKSQAPRAEGIPYDKGAR